MPPLPGPPSDTKRRPRGLYKGSKRALPVDGQERPTALASGSNKKIRRTSNGERSAHDEDEASVDAVEVPPAKNDLEDWEDLKELFERAMNEYEGPDPLSSLSLLRGCIHECDRIQRLHPNPSVIFAPLPSTSETESFGPTTPLDTRLERDWDDDNGPGPWEGPPPSPPVRFTPTLDAASSTLIPKTTITSPSPDLPTAFHTIYGTALYLIATLIARDASLALPGEPSTPTPYYHAALDVFEAGTSLASKRGGEIMSDWKLELAWGRALVSLAEESLNASSGAVTPAMNSKDSGAATPMSSLRDDVSVEMQSPPPPSAISSAEGSTALGAAAALPLPKSSSAGPRGSSGVEGLTPHELLLRGADHFTVGMLHLPGRRLSLAQSLGIGGGAPSTSGGAGSGTTPLIIGGDGNGNIPQADTRTLSTEPPTNPTIPSEPTLTPTSTSNASASGPTPISTPTPTSIPRQKILHSIALQVFAVAERLPDRAHRERWVTWADGVLTQVEREGDDQHSLAFDTAKSRGACALVVGSGWAEELEGALEAEAEAEDEDGGAGGGESVLDSADAESARDALAKAIAHFERAKEFTEDFEADEGDLQSLLAEALLTLANLTRNETQREQLYARAKAEGGVDINLDSDNEGSDDNMSEDE
ncbi:hypothetical protein BOTBODRAFT_41677 [Botryobasidium botryosum FD-172 SS1]|uniref:Uncharacterized protein n=1 Tax=Botryobasidium botryosum (strain FD-172 SS1) TaxID=930990 RepID=A0A067MV49_BOTB1|nr:hypothetical protein BOTBODRAFT_41677 [Botryobasidium botryosum FD-172 SS1]